jgi:hypothetical protein
MYQEGGRREVAVIGHSAGPPVARWALRWWRGVRKRVADFVSLAGINHGAGFESSSASGMALMPPAMWQLSLGSRFLEALNEDEAPGRVDYTAIYSRYDVFQPPPHEGRAAIALGEGRANVANILIQDVCPGMLTEHFSLITDASVYSLIVDALLNDGPASVSRSGAREACSTSPINPSALAAFDRLPRELPGILEDSIANGPPELPLVSEEPPLKPYARSGPGAGAACAREWRPLFTAVRYYRLANRAMSRAVRNHRFAVRVHRATSSARIKSLARSYARRLVRRYFRARSLRSRAISYYFAQRRSIRAEC